MSRKPDVLILSGFLGSGKTTILMQLISHLSEKHGAGYRIAIIENEIGSASVDASIIQDAGYSVTEMLSGCVCCTLIGQLIPSLERLAQELDPQLIILEATGVAAPEDIRDNIVRYSDYPTRIIALADASRWRRIMRALSMLLEAQIEPADTICINKIDLVDDEALAEVECTVRGINPSAPIVRVNASSPIAGESLDLLLGAI